MIKKTKEQLYQMWEKLRYSLSEFRKLEFEEFYKKHNKDKIFAEMCHAIAYRMFTDRVMDAEVNSIHACNMDVQSLKDDWEKEFKRKYGIND